MAKHVRLVRPTNQQQPRNQTERDREAREWIDRITTEQRVWDLRRMGFFEFGAEFAPSCGQPIQPAEPD